MNHPPRKRESEESSWRMQMGRNSNAQQRLQCLEAIRTVSFSCLPAISSLSAHQLCTGFSFDSVGASNCIAVLPFSVSGESLVPIACLPLFVIGGPIGRIGMDTIVHAGCSHLWLTSSSRQRNSSSAGQSTGMIVEHDGSFRTRSTRMDVLHSSS